MKHDGAKGALQRLVLAFMKHTDFHPPRAAKVIAQNDDYTLELQPEGEEWPGMSKVPIRTGIPGCRFRVRPGARVMFAFEGGDPTRPVVTEWDDAAVERLIFKAGIVDLRDEKGRAIACNGDTVMIPTAKGIPVILMMADPVTGLPTPLITPQAGSPMPPLTMMAGGATSGFMILGQVISVSPNRS